MDLSEKSGDKKLFFYGKIEFRTGWRADNQLIGCLFVSPDCHLTFDTKIISIRGRHVTLNLYPRGTPIPTLRVYSTV